MTDDDILTSLKQEFETKKKEYNDLVMASKVAVDTSNIYSDSAFEHNTISKLQAMAELKTELRLLEKKIELLSL